MSLFFLSALLLMWSIWLALSSAVLYCTIFKRSIHVEDFSDWYCDPCLFHTYIGWSIVQLRVRCVFKILRERENASFIEGNTLQIFGVLSKSLSLPRWKMGFLSISNLGIVDSSVHFFFSFTSENTKKKLNNKVKKKIDHLRYTVDVLDVFDQEFVEKHLKFSLNLTTWSAAIFVSVDHNALWI